MAANWRVVSGGEALACEEDNAEVWDGGINGHFSAATGRTASRSDQIGVQDINAFSVQKLSAPFCHYNFGGFEKTLSVSLRCNAGVLCVIAIRAGPREPAAFL